MYPFIRGIPTYTYFYLAAALVHGIVCYLIARRTGVRRRVWLAMTGSYAFGMIVGAKVLFDLGHHVFRLTDLVSFDHYVSGGLWGGPLVVIALGVSLASLAKERARSLDLLALSLPPALCVAHLGCFLEGCCYGRPTSLPWAVRFPHGPVAPAGMPLHPTQLYEIAVLAMTFAMLTLLALRPNWRGLLLGVFLGLYCAGRALIEHFRGDVRLDYAGFSLSQVTCILVALGAAGFVTLRVRQRARHGPSGETVGSA